MDLDGKIFEVNKETADFNNKSLLLRMKLAKTKGPEGVREVLDQV